MKAILVNGEIKTFGSVPKKWSDENGLHLNIGDGRAFGFKDVVTPTYDGRIEELENLHLDGDVFTYDVVDITFTETLAELKANKIQSLKSMVGGKLSKTDWYVIRHADVGTEIPADIKESRADLRDKSDILEADINSLTTKKAVVLFDINL